jgi:hypothetical protein
MNRKIISRILQMPLVLITIASFFGSIYAAVKKINNISWGAPFVLGIVVALYFYGKYLENKPEKKRKHAH